MYEKELDFLISTSYGPGRYDTRYEDDGIDYPLATCADREQEPRGVPSPAWPRHRLARYLRVAQLSNRRRSRGYALLSEPGPKPLLVTLRYPQGRIPARTVQVRPADLAGRTACA